MKSETRVILTDDQALMLEAIAALLGGTWRSAALGAV